MKFGINDLWLCPDCERTRNASHNEVLCAQLNVAIAPDQHQLHDTTSTTVTAADTNSARAATGSADNAEVVSVKDRRASARVSNRNVAGLSSNVTTAVVTTRNRTTRLTTNRCSQQPTKRSSSAELPSTDVTVSAVAEQSDVVAASSVVAAGTDGVAGVLCDSQPTTTDKLQHRQRRTGQCTACLRQLSLTVAGVIHQHGPGEGCAGSGQPPVDGSVTCKQSEAEVKITQETSGDCLDPHQLIHILKADRCRVLKRLPKASRSLAAGKLATLLARIVASPDELMAWSDLMRFSFTCFAIPGGRGGKRHLSSLTSKVNRALRAYPLVIERTTPSVNRTDKTRPSTKDNLAARISEKLEEGDIRGAIRLAASDDTMAPHDERTLTALRAKHPPRAVSSSGPVTTDSSSQRSPPHTFQQTLIIHERDVINAVKSFPAGSAGGLDGMRPQHLKDMMDVEDEAGHRLRSCLTDFVNLCLAGGVPLSIRPVFCGASLCALNKKGGGIRPIAVGCTLRRVVAKTAARSVQEKMSAKMAPTQLGFGVKQGTEAAAHAARCFLLNLRPGQALLKLDFVNAFNSLSRNDILQTIYDDLPELFPFISSCYSAGSHLSFGDFILESEEGAQQGDPLGPLVFCASSLKLAKLLKSELNIWFMDDGTLGGDVDVLIHDYETVRRIGKELGLVLNEQKCELITGDPDVVNRFKSVAPRILHINTCDATLLGAPIGGKASMEAVLSKKIGELRLLTDRLKKLGAHDAFFLLKNCFSLPKLLYILRCAPCYQSQILVQYDETIRDALKSILNIELRESSWNQATLPVKNGGIGIRLATQVSLPAFLSSVSSSSELMLKLLPSRLHITAGVNDPAFTLAVEEWKLRAGVSELPVPSDKQKSWDTSIVKIALERVWSAATNQMSIARLTAAAASHSGAFLQALPSSAVGTRLDDTTLRIAIALRLGAPVCAPHTCVCGEAVDESGSHGLSCRKSAGRHMRHGALNDLVKRALAMAEVPSRLEPTSLFRSDGKRPDGMSLMPWKRGQCLVWDVTCPDTLAASYLNRAVNGAGAVANEAERRKHLKYEEISRSHYFVPIAVETLGAIGEETTFFLKELSDRAAAVTKDPRSMTFLLQRISVTVQQGNAACIIGTMSNGPNPDELLF